MRHNYLSRIQIKFLRNEWNVSLIQSKGTADLTTRSLVFPY